MSLISNLPPSGGAGGALFNVVPTAIAQANGAAGTSATAQQLLPTAVIAPSLVPAYAEKPRTVTPTAEQPTALRPPSSPLAAQFIAQTPEATPETLKIFQPPSPLATAPLATASSAATNAALSQTAATKTEAAPVKTPSSQNESVISFKRSPLGKASLAYQAPANAIRANLLQHAVEAVG